MIDPPMNSAPFLRRVALKNYKSISACDVRLRALTFLVGRNGAGKSNFLDAPRFVADSPRTSLDHALRDRGGVAAVHPRRPPSAKPIALSVPCVARMKGMSTGETGRIDRTP